jgi:serine/threonine-protein kinase
VLRAAIVALGAGFLFTLVLVWYHGEQGRQRVSGAELVLIAGLLAATGLALVLVTRGNGAGAEQPDRVAAEELDPQRVAVLPFRNANPDDADGDILAAGVHDDLLTRLSRIADLTVVSRTSVMEYAHTTKRIQAIAGELSAGTILEGGVQRAGSNVRINVQLIDGRTDEHLWAETYTRPWSLDNLFAIQTEIAEAVATALSATLSGEERASLAARPTESEEAYARYVEMRALWADQARDGLAEIVALGEVALEYDPDFLQVHALMSVAHSFSYWQRMDRTAARLDLARTSADAALALDADHPDALTALGLYHYWGFLEYERAIDLFGQALEVAPRHGEALAGLAAVLRRSGRMEESVPYFQQAYELDPRNRSAVRALAETYDMLRRCNESDPLYQRMTEVGVMLWEDRISRADHYVACDHLPEAREQALLAIRSSGGASEPTGMAANIELLARQPRSVLELLAAAPEEVSWEPQMLSWPRALQQGDAYALLGLRDSARAKYDEAIAYLRSRIEQTPDDERLWGALGLAYGGAGRKQEAIRAGRRATELLPVEREAWRGAHRMEELARTYTRVGEHERALDLLERLMAMPVGLVLSPAHLRMDAAWDPIREDARFRRLAREP